MNTTTPDISPASTGSSGISLPAPSTPTPAYHPRGPAQRPSPTVIVCNDCHISFTGSKAFLDHQHPINSPFRCPVRHCREILPSTCALAQHDALNASHLNCHFCKRAYPSTLLLLQHFSRAHAFCSKCLLVFNDPTALQNHNITSGAHHFCPECRHDFLTAHKLSRHYLHSAGFCPAHASYDVFRKVSEERRISVGNVWDLGWKRWEEGGCTMCLGGFADKEEAAVHMWEVHGLMMDGSVRRGDDGYIRHLRRHLSERERALQATASDQDDEEEMWESGDDGGIELAY